LNQQMDQLEHDGDSGKHSHGLAGSYHATRNIPDELLAKQHKPSTILSIIQKSHPAWAGIKLDQIRVRKIEAALTNIVYVAKLYDHVAHDGEYRKILVRLFGSKTDYLDRELEEKIIHSAAKTGIGPELIATFEGGRLEQFLDAKVLHVKELPEWFKTIAEKLAEFHDTPSFAGESTLFNRLDKWFQKAKSITFSKESETGSKESINYDLLQKVDFDYLEKELAGLKERMKNLNSPIVLSHNDLQENNILADRKTGEIYFIDFEYGGPNYRGFDFGNHFCEWTIEYGLTDGDGFKIVHTDFPTEEQQIEFFTSYKAASKLASDATVDQLLAEGLIFSLASHFLWGLWGVFQAKDSTIEFGYMQYALQRFEGYRYVKEKLKR